MCHTGRLHKFQRIESVGIFSYNSRIQLEISKKDEIKKLENTYVFEKYGS